MSTTKLSPYQQKIADKFEKGYSIIVYPGINGGKDNHELIRPDHIIAGDVNIKTIEKLLKIGIIKESTWTSKSGVTLKQYIKS